MKALWRGLCGLLLYPFVFDLFRSMLCFPRRNAAIADVNSRSMSCVGRGRDGAQHHAFSNKPDCFSKTRRLFQTHRHSYAAYAHIRAEALTYTRCSPECAQWSGIDESVASLEKPGDQCIETRASGDGICRWQTKKMKSRTTIRKVWNLRMPNIVCLRPRSSVSAVAAV
nr:hypothetical protein CFP56_52407 [Quercus suber]